MIDMPKLERTKAEPFLSRRNRVGLIVLVLLLALILIRPVIVGAIPFAPYAVDAYEVVPPVKCVGGPVKVRIGRSFHHPLFGYADRFDLRSTWVKVPANPSDTRVSYDLPPTDGSLRNTREGYIFDISPVARTAPPEAGQWRLHSTITIQGKILGLPVTEIYTYQSGDILETVALQEGVCPIP